MGKASASKQRSSHNLVVRRNWIQDTTLYIEPTSNVRTVHLEDSWATLNSGRLSEKLGF